MCIRDRMNVEELARQLDCSSKIFFHPLSGTCFHQMCIRDRGVPSYAGRVPEMAVRSLRSFLGNNTPAIIVSVYGNRAYDDTLIELTDLMESHGFKLLSACLLYTSILSIL